MSNEPRRVDQEMIRLLGLDERWAKACRLRSNEAKRRIKLDEIEDTALRQLWGTPPEMVRGIEVILGRRFTLDICAEAHSSKAPLHFGPGSALEVYDSFRDPWPSMHRLDSLHWGNPDYNGKRKDRWVELVLKHNYQTVLNLPLSTDMWYAAAINEDSRCHVTMLTGRPEYIPPEGIEASKPKGPTVLVAMNFHTSPLPPSIHIDKLMRLGAEAMAKDSEP